MTIFRRALEAIRLFRATPVVADDFPAKRDEADHLLALALQQPEFPELIVVSWGGEIHQYMSTEALHKMTGPTTIPQGVAEAIGMVKLMDALRFCIQTYPSLANDVKRMGVEL
jgi:hypothetical protein